MPFTFPSLEEILYRAWRLRRLIAVATALPFVVLALLGLVGLNGLAGTTGGLIALLIVHLALIGAHAVLFPNAAEETASLSVVLAVFALIMATVPGTIVALILCLGFAVWAMIWGQAMVPELQSRTETHDPETTARIRVKAKPEAVRSWFPLRPNSQRGHIKCGPKDKTGAFPVWFDLAELSIDIFAGGPHVEGDVMDRVMSKLGGDPDHTEEVPVNPSAEATGEPSFWARIDIDEPDLQRTRLFFRDDAGGETDSALVEHRFRSTKAGVVVTETDTTMNYPKGLSLGMWLTDFQLDGLIHSRELLENTVPKSLRSAHRWSLLTLGGRWFAVKQVDRADAA
ncbi:MAG: hypothetical protein AAFY31_00650 [Pseudomonadota bacterium]